MRALARNILQFLADRLGLIVCLIVADWLFCSIGFMICERHQTPAPGPISSLWWGIVTASTTGYGDYAPKTTAGRFFGATLMVSMDVLKPLMQAALIAWLSRDLWTHKEQEQIKRDLRENNVMLRHLLEEHGADVPALLKESS